MKVTIGEQEYVPASALGNDANETARAIIRAHVSGYYHNSRCHVDGGAPKTHCDCSGCTIHRLAVQFLGEEPECKEETDSGFLLLWKAAER